MNQSDNSNWVLDNSWADPTGVYTCRVCVEKTGASRIFCQVLDVFKIGGGGVQRLIF